MSEVIIADALEQLKPFLNDKKVLEIVIRGKNKRIRAFQKVALNDLPQPKAKELAEKIIHTLNRNTGYTEKSLSFLRNIVKAQQLGLILNGLNLCATCAGFAIMYAKLDQMSTEINQQLIHLQNMMKQGLDVQGTYEFNKVLSDHTNMLDSRRLQKPYPEEKMRELVDREYNVLVLLIDMLQKDITADRNMMITTVFSLLSMFTVSLCYFDEQYYCNNHELLENENVWHSAHEKWMSVYSTLIDSWFIELLQDHGTFDTELTTTAVDVYYITLLDQVLESRQQVEDNQELVQTLGDVKLLNALRKMNDQDVKDTIENALKSAFEGVDDPEAVRIYEEAMQQAAIA